MGFLKVKGPPASRRMRQDGPETQRSPERFTSSNNADPISRQAAFVARRFALPIALASAVAALAFDNGRRA